MEKISQQLQEQFNKMSATGKLFRSSLSGILLWGMYLKSFSSEDNPVFRDPASSSHNCNNCNNFIRRYGNIVALDENNNIITLFDVIPEKEYQASFKTMSKRLKELPIANIFLETFDELNGLPYESCKKNQEFFKLGIEKNFKQYTQAEVDLYGVMETDKIYTFNHMMVTLSKYFVDFSEDSIESIMGRYRDSKEVFKRALDEISADTLLLVRDLILQGSLLDGRTHLHKVETILGFKQVYDTIPVDQRDNWTWKNSYSLGIARFKNELIGVLCSDLSQGVEINKACQDWNKRVDPANYMKAVAPITKQQIEEAKKFVEENGYEESFDRRMATLTDIKVDEILHSNTGKEAIKSVSMFDDVKPTFTRHKKSEFKGVEEVTIEKFMQDILPTTTSVELFLLPEHKNNLVTLTTANIAESKPIFKWSNNYSWTYKGDLAGKSMIKEAVKTAGGNISGVLRASMIWNDNDGKDNSDLDLWCRQPNNELIGYSSNFRKDRGNNFSSCNGQLDLDNTQPSGKLAVENIYFTDSSRLKEGVYIFWVNQYSNRNSQGFKFEIEFDGQIFQYEYNKAVNGQVEIAEVVFKNGEFTIKHRLNVASEGGSTQPLYGLDVNQFHKVNLVCLSPNHWRENNVGNKHFFFMLEGCKSPDEIRSFHNENLLPELAQHRKVFEVLGAVNKISSTDKQLSGLGFNATVREEVIVKLTGSFKRTIKIKF